MRKVNRARYATEYTTELGTKVTEQGSEITLETPKASVSYIREYSAQDETTRTMLADMPMWG